MKSKLLDNLWAKGRDGGQTCLYIHNNKNIVDLSSMFAVIHHFLLPPPPVFL